MFWQKCRLPISKISQKLPDMKLKQERDEEGEDGYLQSDLSLWCNNIVNPNRSLKDRFSAIKKQITKNRILKIHSKKLLSQKLYHFFHKILNFWIDQQTYQFDNFQSY